jgi:hypothetical protein
MDIRRTSPSSKVRAFISPFNPLNASTRMARNGIPIRFAHPILARGDKVIATSRKLEKVQRLEQAGAAVLPLDVRIASRVSTKR